MTTMMGLPLVSILMFILAGILIGHLLWYHDRKIDLRRISKLEDRYQLAKGTALKRKQEFLRVQSEIGSHQHLLDQIRAEANAALAKQRQAEEEARVTKNRLIQFDHQRSEMAEKIDAETRRNESLVGQLKEALQLKTAAEQRLAQSSQSHESTEEISATYRDRIEQLQLENVQLAEHHEVEVEKLRAVISQQAAAAAQTTREKESAIIRLTDELQSQQKSRHETTKSIQSTQHRIETLSDELKAVQADRERLVVALKAKADELITLQQTHQQLNQENESTLDELTQKITSVQRELENRTAQHQRSLADLSKQRTQQEEVQQKLQALDTLKAELEAAKSKLAEQEANSQKQAKLIADQQSELSKHLEAAKANEHKLIQLREQDKELQELRKLSQQFDATKHQLAESKQQVSVVAADRQKLQDLHQRISTEAELLRNKFAENTRKVEALQKQLADKESVIEQVSARARETGKQLEIQTAAATKLSKELEAVERLRPINHDLQQRLDETLKRLSLITAEHEDSLESNAKAEDRIRDLQNQLHDYANKIRDQRRRLAAAGDLSASDALPNEDRKAA